METLSWRVNDKNSSVMDLWLPNRWRMFDGTKVVSERWRNWYRDGSMTELNITDLW